MSHLKKLLLYGALFILATAAAFAQEAKNALLIANGDYARDMGALSQPIPEATALKSALESIGFNVTLVKNANLEDMQKALVAFKAKTQREGGYAFFHYGGHAIQSTGVNYLVPLRVTIEDEQDVVYECLDVGRLVTSMNGESNIVVLDSSFISPFVGSPVRGLLRPEITQQNEAFNSFHGNGEMANFIIVYSAIPGTSARDGIFTPILTQRITEKNKSFYEVFQKVRNDVDTATGGTQKALWQSILFSDIYLAGDSR